MDKICSIILSKTSSVWGHSKRARHKETEGRQLCLEGLKRRPSRHSHASLEDDSCNSDPRGLMSHSG
jgi:hypothetical protein